MFKNTQRTVLKAIGGPKNNAFQVHENLWFWWPELFFCMPSSEKLCLANSTHQNNNHNDSSASREPITSLSKQCSSQEEGHMLIKGHGNVSKRDAGLPIGSMWLVVFPYIYHKKSTIHVGKYTSPMDPMAYRICDYVFSISHSITRQTWYLQVSFNDIWLRTKPSNKNGVSIYCKHG